LIIGSVVLWLPGWGRISAVPWIASGTLGLPDLVWEGTSWGPISSFSMLGLALGLTGAYVASRPAPATLSRPTTPESTPRTGAHHLD
jgi:hypothetical protein